MQGKLLNLTKYKSIQICNPNKISIPANAHINIASEINLNPIVNHQIIKNGFRALSAIPAINGLCLRLEKLDSLLRRTSLICIPANNKKRNCT